MLPEGKIAWLELKIKGGSLSDRTTAGFAMSADGSAITWSGASKTLIDDVIAFSGKNRSLEVLIEYSRHSARRHCNLFAASPAQCGSWEKILGLKQPVGAGIAHRGVAVEDGVTVGLLNPDAPLAGVRACDALTKYDTDLAMVVSTDETP